MTSRVGRWIPRLLVIVGVVVEVILLVASGVVAYAWNDGGRGDCGGSYVDHCPTEGVFWTTPVHATPSTANVKCAISIDSDYDNLIEDASNLAPGQYCSFSARLTSTEEQTVTITESLTTLQPSYCKLFAYADNVFHSPPNSILSGHYFAYRGTLSLSSSAGNACEGAFAMFYVGITATPLERCSGDR